MLLIQFVGTLDTKKFAIFGQVLTDKKKLSKQVNNEDENLEADLKHWRLKNKSNSKNSLDEEENGKVKESMSIEETKQQVSSTLEQCESFDSNFTIDLSDSEVCGDLRLDFLPEVLTRFYSRYLLIFRILFLSS